MLMDTQLMNAGAIGICLANLSSPLSSCELIITILQMYLVILANVLTLFTLIGLPYILIMFMILIA